MKHKRNSKQDPSWYENDPVMKRIRFGLLLRDIHDRLVAEGKVKIADGKIVFVGQEYRSSRSTALLKSKTEPESDQPTQTSLDGSSIDPVSCTEQGRLHF
jgi:hypothetical protein